MSTTIDWPGLTDTWNPVVGCRRGCDFCYARKMYENPRYKAMNPEGKPFSEMVFFPERLKQWNAKQKPRKIFVGSMSDCEYWSLGEWFEIIKVCVRCPQHTFMFLTKGVPNLVYPQMPANCMQGVTKTKVEYFDYLTWCNSVKAAQRPFISLEPLLGMVDCKFQSVARCCELVICGPQTKPNIAPKPEWIDSVRRNVPPEKLYWKDSMKPYIGYSGFESQH